MPQLTLPEALRYFFSPFVIVFYFCLVLPETAQRIAKDFGAIPTAAAIVAGVTIYYVYRYCLYNCLILPLYDKYREWRGPDNQRLFIMKRYGLSRNFIYSTVTANRVLHELSDKEEYSAAMTKRGRPIRASGVHLLYQSGIFAFFFSILAFHYHEWPIGGGLLVFCGTSVVYCVQNGFRV
jgi:hypothetical protein